VARRTVEDDDTGDEDPEEPEEEPEETINTEEETTSEREQKQAYAVAAFEAHQKNQSSIGNQRLVRGMIRDIVRNKLFRAFKFVTEDDLYYKGTIAKYIMKQTGQASETTNDRTKQKFWKQYRDTVKKALDSKRSTSAMAVKREVISKYNYLVQVVFNWDG